MNPVKTINTRTTVRPQDTDHRHNTDRYKLPTDMSIESVVPGATIAQWGGPEVAKNTPSAADYVAALVNSVNTFMNSDNWREDADEAISCEFRPAHTEPTVQQIVLLEDRTVEFDPRTSLYDRTKKVSEGKAIAGDFLFSEPCSHAALFSGRFTVLDHNVIGGFTAAGVAQTASKFLTDFQVSCNTMVAKILAKTANLRKVDVAMPKGAPREIAEDLLDILAMNVDTAFGSGVSDFTLMVPIKLAAILDRAAQRAGFEEADELIGTGIQYHQGPDVIFMVPKSFAMLSFREDSDGDIWKLTTSRNPNAQGYDVEITGVADVVADSMVKLKLANPEDPSERLQTVTVPFPVVTMITLTP
ncbi:hypothetical protein DA83_02790 [Pseudomonas sp. 250J]|uniref:hypothetical protein n=2 Tax=unclassified Pseudomonas TaxID=196821 RepID=UPI000680F212|nr:hypothetical protein [Pseudomonas sp. 250J]KNX77267.1 hypothetical protein DA83_02790 [Pseudomonas sp. 250J]